MPKRDEPTHEISYAFVVRIGCLCGWYHQVANLRTPSRAQKKDEDIMLECLEQFRKHKAAHGK